MVNSTFKILFSIYIFIFSVNVQAQIANGYEVGTWSGFKSAAITYTFDDNTSNQLPVALPIFNQHEMKVTFFVVTDWMSNWSGFKSASDQGHEIASHTVTHPSALASSNQENELGSSQNIINSNISNASCVTIAYPNCNIGDRSLLQKYYIAGRTCSGQLIPSSPTDFLSLSSIICGSQGSVKTANDFNSKANEAKNSKSWAVFLIHGIDNDGGYSPVNSSDLRNHLSFMNTNKNDFWIGTFRDVVKYIKERNAASIQETEINEDSLSFILSDQLDNKVYNLPISIRRSLPSNWEKASVYKGQELVPSTMVQVGGQNYITFEAIPDEGPYFIGSGKSTITNTLSFENLEKINLVPNPFTHQAELNFPGNFVYSVMNANGTIMESGEGTDSKTIGTELLNGVYFVTVYKEDKIFNLKLVKN